MESHASALVRFLAGLRFADVPETVRARAELAFIDSLGCGLFGGGLDWGRIVGEVVFDEESRGRASVFANGKTASAARAALANGTSVHGFELDDVISETLVHPGSVIVPAALATAQETGASGERFLLGVIAGYEMMHRVGGALGIDQSNRGFHTTGIAGPAGAAVAAGIVRGLDVDRLLSAIGLAASCAAGIKSFSQPEGGMVKRLHAGRAAEAGVMAAAFAQRGFTGPPNALEGAFGLLDVIGGVAANASLLDAALGESFALTQVWTKMYPCCALIHAPLQAIEELRAANRFAPHDVAKIRIGSSKRGVEQNGNRAPVDTMSAQYSMPFCAALAVGSDPKDPTHYDEANLGAEAIRALIDRIELFIEPKMQRIYPRSFGASVAIELRNGSTFATEVCDPRGTAVAPCDPAELDHKFLLLARSVRGIDADRLLRVAREVRAQPSLDALSAELANRAG